jgi:hypothetical protein
MTTIYEKAPAECRDICDRMMKQYHGELTDFGVTVDLLLATMKVEENFKPGSVTLKLRGYPVAAYIKINPYKLRVQGHADAEMVIDGDRWPDMSDEQKDALMDHELEHLLLKKNKDGEVQFDDLDRPKLTMALHSHQFGWFDSIARRHGGNSFEVQQYTEFKCSMPRLWEREQPAQEQPAQESAA